MSGWWLNRRLPIRSRCGCPNCKWPTLRHTRWLYVSYLGIVLIHRVLSNNFSQPFAPFLEPVPEGVTSVNEFSVPAPDFLRLSSCTRVFLRFSSYTRVWRCRWACTIFYKPFQTREPAIPAQSSQFCLAFLYIQFGSNQMSSPCVRQISSHAHLVLQ